MKISKLRAELMQFNQKVFFFSLILSQTEIFGMQQMRQTDLWDLQYLVEMKK
jgi:hypothetical protein